MVSCVQIEGLTKSFGDRLLFADVTFGVYEGDKIGVIARNGTGKSTMLRIIAGKEDRDSGNVVFRSGLRVGYLEQTPQIEPETTPLQYMEALPHREEDDWTFRDRAASMLGQVGVHELDKPMGQMSGGQVKRVALARVLMGNPDLLMLDEPTNHLDIEVIEWLENYLSRQRVALLMVTHDRYFLDKVCNKIIEIDDRTTYTYKGNYDYYLQKRQERRDAYDAETAKVKNLLRGELEWMRRQPQARGSKAKYRIDNFHELERRASQANAEARNVALDMKGGYIGSKIFEARGLSKSFGDKCVLRDWSYDFARYDKVGVVGPNGIGKTTFIRLLMGLLQPDSGTIDVGTTVRWGYYSQQGMQLDDNKRIIDVVRDVADEVKLSGAGSVSASQFLCRFLFDPADQQKFIGTLSGGEKRRLYLALVLMRNPNFLVLDEPTNDLDIATLAVLEDYLTEFNGCVIAVSHDRFFLDRFASHLFVLEPGGNVMDFPGDYSTYRHCVQQREKERKAAEASSRPETETPQRQRREAAERRRLTFKERKEMEALEDELPRLEEEKAQLEADMSSGTMKPDEIAEAGRRIAVLIEEIDTKELRLLELMEYDA